MFCERPLPTTPRIDGLADNLLGWNCDALRVGDLLDGELVAATCVAACGAVRWVFGGPPCLAAVAERVGDGLGWLERRAAGRAVRAVALGDGESLSRGDARRGVDWLAELRATDDDAGARVGVAGEDDAAGAGVAADGALLATILLGD